MPREVVYARCQCQIWKKAYCKRTARNDSNASIVRKIFLSSIAKGTADPGVDCLIQSAYRVLYILHILHIHRIYNFSFVQKLHLPVTGVKGAPLSITFHLMSKVEPLALSSQMWVLNLVSPFLLGLVKELLWPKYLLFQGGAETPT